MTAMHESISRFQTASLYSNEEIYSSLGVGNTRGVRVNLNEDRTVKRIAIFTSIPTPRQLAENPYHDRLEGDILIYTGEGKAGEQSVSGANARIIEQLQQKFPIHGFIQVAGRRDKNVGVRRWGYLGLLEYLRGYQEKQIDARKQTRTVWIFEFRVHSAPQCVTVAHDGAVMRELLAASQSAGNDDREVVGHVAEEGEADDLDLVALEETRKRLLSYDPRTFEHVISDILLMSGFDRVEVTQYSNDGGIDLNARLSKKIWPLRHLLTQVQAKRWLHTVGRKEIAELRGSLQPHAAGCIVTTSHFSRSAMAESTESGKVPISTIDGFALARIVNALPKPVR